MANDAVDGRGGGLVAARHRAPLAELDARGDDHAPPPVAVAYRLEERPRTLQVHGRVAELVEYHELRPGDVAHRRLGPPPPSPARARARAAPP